jgi:predicted metalloprotease with PDZ domain
MPRITNHTFGALSLLGALALVGSPPSLPAQDHDDDHDRDRPFTFTMTSRPRIGVMVDSRANAETDRYGARLSGVTEDGPAAKAGLKEGDIVTRFNGVALGGLKGEDDESGPGAKLVELARKLDAGDTVEVEYRRDGQSKKATLVAADLSGMAMREFRMRMPDLERMRIEPGELPKLRVGPEDGPRGFMFEGGPGDFRVFVDGRPMGLRLTDLNADLGEYFGAKSGALVLETPADSALPLRAGDVILSIDGRTVSDADAAHRILRSYAAGETAKVEVQRKQRKVTLTWKAPAERRRGPEGELRRRTPAPSGRVRIERT